MEWKQRKTFTPPLTGNLSLTTRRRVRPLRGLGALASTVLVLAFSAAFAALPAAVSAAPLPSTTVELLQPANSDSAYAESVAVACDAPGSCSVVGYYEENTGGNLRLMVAQETDGVWGAATEVAQPANSNNTSGVFNAVACDAPGSCSAVGNYYDNLGKQHTLVAQETGGVWGAATEVTQPIDSNYGRADLSAVACDASGSCSAVGYYTDDSGGNQRIMVAQESGGVWGAATEVAQPANHNLFPYGDLNAVACDAPGSCSAIGYYDGSGTSRRVMVAQETGEVWGAATEVAQPAGSNNADASFQAVTCDAPGSCFAAGWYTDSSGNWPTMIAQETGGAWGAATAVALPANSNSNADSSFYAVACDAPGSCTALGSYADSSNNDQLVVAQESGGVWAAATEMAQPVDSGHTNTSFYAAACDAPGSCTAVGSYRDGDGNRHAMVAQETGGVWGAATEVAQPANSGSTGANLYAATCDATGSCTAVGYYTDSSGNTRAMATARLPAASIDPTSHDFGDQDIASGPTDNQTFTVTNTGTADLHGAGAPSITGSGAADFNYTGGTCFSGPIAPGDHCTVTVNFSPLTSGYKLVTLSIGDDASDTPQTVTLTGTGTTAAAPAPTVTLTVNGSANPTLDYGATATLAWTSTNASSCAATGDWSGAQALAGTASFPDLTQGQYYALTCTGPGGSVAASALVSVRTRCETTPTAAGCTPAAPLPQVSVSPGKGKRGSSSATYVLDGRGSTDPNGGTIASYQWTLRGHVVGRASTLTRRLAYGRTYTFTLTVTNTAGLAGTTTITVRPTRGKPARAKYVTLFPSNRYDLTRSAKQQLRLVAARLRRSGVKRLVVAGYTDSLGTRAYNLAFSKLRAETVAAYLEAKLGLAKDKVLVRSCGATHFVAPNTRRGYDNPAGRARNRRVVVTAYLR